MSDWIINHMPKHEVYLEPFAGSLSVLLNKPRCHIETVNDINGDVVNFFRVLRDSPEELAKRLELTPYARREYDESYSPSEMDDMERARRFCVRCWQGFGCSNVYHNGFKSGQQSNSPNPAKAWSELPNHVMQAAERLRGVQIEQLPATELLKRYDTKDVFIYADPPYLSETRKSHLYRHEMSDRDHAELLDILTSHKGMVMISGYENELYNHMLKGWKKVQKETLAEGGRKRTETLWMNYKSAQLSLLDYEY